MAYSGQSYSSSDFRGGSRRIAWAILAALALNGLAQAGTGGRQRDIPIKVLAYEQWWKTPGRAPVYDALVILHFVDDRKCTILGRTSSDGWLFAVEEPNDTPASLIVYHPDYKKLSVHPNLIYVKYPGASARLNLGKPRHKKKSPTSSARPEPKRSRIPYVTKHLSIRVQDPDGNPIRDALVLGVRYADADGGIRNDYSTIGVTDSRGALVKSFFTMSSFPHEYLVIKGGFRPVVTMAKVVVLHRQDKAEEPRRKTVSITVVADDRAPVARASVNLYDGKELVKSGQTDARGRVQFKDCPVKDLDVKVTRQGFKLSDQAARGPLLLAQKTSLQVVMRAVEYLATIRGRVLAEGRPVANAKVKVQCGDKIENKVTDAGGKFLAIITYKHGRNILVEVRGEGLGSSSQVLPSPPREEVVLQLNRLLPRLYVLVNRAQSMSRYRFSDVKRASIELVDRASRTRGWDGVALASCADGTVLEVLPFFSGTLDAASRKRATRSLMALAAAGGDTTVEAFSALADALSSEETAKDAGCHVIMITGPDPVLAGIPEDHARIKQLVERLARDRISVHIAQLCLEEPKRIPAMAAITAGRHGAYKVIPLERTADLARELLSYRWHLPPSGRTPVGGY